MGNGDKSAAQCYKLHQNLEAIFNHIGGLQQPCHHDCDVTCEYSRSDAEFEIEVLAYEVVKALGFPDAELGKWSGK